MCEPTSLAVASVALGPIGQLQGGDAAKAQADFQAQISENNAVIASRAAGDTRVRGDIRAGEREQKTAQDIGRQRVALAASGQLVDTGSALELTSDTAAVGKLDALRIVNNAEREAIGLETQASNFRSEAAAQRTAGKNARRASRIDAMNSLINNATDTGFKVAGLIA